MIRSLLLIGLASVLASCQSMSNGFFSVEGRAIVYHDVSVDDVDAATSFNEHDVGVESYGVQGAFNTPIVDFLASLDYRKYEGESTPELDVGVRRRFLEVWIIHPYVEGNIRYGFDLDNGIDSSSYWGWNLGVGVLFDVIDDVFVDAKILYETAEVELPGGDSTADGVIGMIGVGYDF